MLATLWDVDPAGLPGFSAGTVSVSTMGLANTDVIVIKGSQTKVYTRYTFCNVVRGLCWNYHPNRWEKELETLFFTRQMKSLSHIGLYIAVGRDSDAVLLLKAVVSLQLDNLDMHKLGFR